MTSSSPNPEPPRHHSQWRQGQGMHGQGVRRHMNINAAAISPELRATLRDFQQKEITEHHVYRRLARRMRNRKNQDILEHIAQDEQGHYNTWKNYTGTDVKPDLSSIRFYILMARIFGVTFAVKLMESGEKGAQKNYQQVMAQFPETKKIVEDECRHEKELINVLHEEKLEHMGSIVLGLNDALVELTGALAGLSFALQNTRLIALAGLVTGIAASMSMAGSEYLSKKTEQKGNPLKSSIYTGIAYIITVMFLITPFLVLADYRVALVSTLIIAILIIASFTFFSATVQDESFKKRFAEMATISLGVALISFFVGIALRQFFGVEI